MRNPNVARVIESTLNVKFKAAIHWIAYNDEPGDMEIRSVRRNITVCLIADIFNKTTFTVARAVVAERRKGIAHGRLIP